MFRPLAPLMIFLLAWAGGSAAAQQTSQTFNSPTVNGVRLDWCKHFGSQCGEPAATVFCQQKGFARATEFSIDPGIGRDGVPTMVTGDGRLCRQAICSGFQAITCVRQAAASVTPTPSPRREGREQVARPPTRLADPKMIEVPINRYTTRFRYPHLNDQRLDWCLNWGSNCGEVAANRFCQEMGFARASRHVKDTGTGERGIPSLVLDDNRLCTGGYCNAFKMIACTRRPASQTVAEASDAQPNADSTPAPETTDLLPDTSEVAFVAPLPRPKPPLPPSAADTDAGQAKPAAFAGFEVLAPTVVAVNWVNLLDSIKRYPGGASLSACTGTDCTGNDNADFEIDPEADSQDVRLKFRVGDVPHASGALWQVSYLPYPPFAQGSETDLSPQGLLDYQTVNVAEGWFTFDPQALAKDLPGGKAPAILHVRVLPVSEAGLEQVVGQPSNTLRIFYGADLPKVLPYTSYARETVPDSQPKLRLTRLAFQPFHQVEEWPPGCKAPEKANAEGSDTSPVDVSLIGNWRWNSRSYQWTAARLVAIAGDKTGNGFTDGNLEYAVNAALVSAGIPPDIPNLNVMMRDGADGLAQALARAIVEQVDPADLAARLAGLAEVATGEGAATLSEEDLRTRLEVEVEKRSKAALMETVDELDKELAKDDRNRPCTNTTFHGAYTVTIENTGDVRYSDLEVAIKAEPIYRRHDWTIDLDPGEQVTLVGLGAPMLPNGPYSKVDLSADARAKEDLERWKSELVDDVDMEIEVFLPGALECLGGDPTSQFCERKSVVAHSSPPQRVTESYEYSQ